MTLKIDNCNTFHKGIMGVIDMTVGNDTMSETNDIKGIEVD